MSVAVVIPFRDRGRDPLRQANLDTVLDHWEACGYHPVVVGDGRAGDAQFNRSAAYNNAVRQLPDTEVFVFTESDMLIDPAQIEVAAQLAALQPGLVVPFTDYCYLSESAAARVRAGVGSPMTHEWTMEDGRAVGAINVVSRASLEAVGQYDECFAGSWWDDRAMRRAFDMCTAATRFVPGPAYHLYHLPGWQGQHLTPADRQQSKRNRRRFQRYMAALNADQIRALTMEGAHE